MTADKKEEAARPSDAGGGERPAGLGIAAVIGGIAVSALGLALLAIRRGTKSADGHAAPDLAADADVSADARAPEHFRPDPTAVPTAQEREALRPATGPAPGFAAERGSFAAGPARADA